MPEVILGCHSRTPKKARQRPKPNMFTVRF